MEAGGEVEEGTLWGCGSQERQAIGTAEGGGEDRA
jgi:hypothetical protein